MKSKLTLKPREFQPIQSANSLFSPFSRQKSPFSPGLWAQSSSLSPWSSRSNALRWQHLIVCLQFSSLISNLSRLHYPFSGKTNKFHRQVGTLFTMAQFVTISPQSFQETKMNSTNERSSVSSPLYYAHTTTTLHI